MRIKMLDTVESVHKWIDEDGGEHRVVLDAAKGELISVDELEGEGIGDAPRALRKLVKLGFAEQVEG